MGNRRIRSHLSFLFLLVRDRSVMVTSILATIADAEDNTISELCKGVPHGKTQDMEFPRASHIALQADIFVTDGHESNVLGIRFPHSHPRREWGDHGSARWVILLLSFFIRHAHRLTLLYPNSINLSGSDHERLHCSLGRQASCRSLSE